MTFTKDFTIKFWSLVKKGPACWEWQGRLLENGYGRISFKGKAFKAHRIAYLLINGEISPDKLICHSCDNKKCCNPFHLWQGTPQQNSQDRAEKFRGTFGETVNTCKLTEAKVLEIRKIYTPRSASRLARQFGVTHTNILMIIQRKTWKHI